LGEIPVVVIVPARAKAEDRLPVLVAFHGRGESQKGPARGVRGWLDDYQLGHTLERLAAPPLTRDDFKGFVTDSRLKEHNARLQRQPYRPLIIVMPYLPDALKRVEVFDNGAALATLIVDRVLPRVYSETPARVGATGVDGVSLGGRASLLVGLSRPRAFAVVGAMQAALDDSELDAFAALGEQAHRANPRLELRLLTTRDDPFLDVNTELHARLERRAVPSELRVVPGPHSYTFNRGPGGYEMLLFQESELYDLGEP
jgi:enterochelin esterase-like enzyme